MNRHVPRRAAVLTAAALTTAAFGVLSGLTPAAAAAGDPVITMQKPATIALPTAPADGSGASTQSENLQFTTDASSLQTSVTLTIDARGLAQIADVTFSDNCTVENSIATCSEDFYDDDPQGTFGGVTNITLAARAGVAPGATATYKVTGTAAPGTVVGATGSVQVGGPAFDQTQPPEHTGLAVGSTVDEPVEFANIGDRPAAAAQVLLMASPGLTFAQHFSNCTYTSVPDAAPAEEAVCTFAQPVQVGERARLATPVEMNVTSAAYYTYLDTETAPKGDAFIRRTLADHTWTQGTGGRLGLTVLDPGQPGTAPAGTVSLPFTDDHGDYRITALQAANTADFSVSGADVQAAQGDTVPLDVSMTDNGPATIYNRGGDPINVTVTLPPGTTVVGSPAHCWPQTADDPQTTAHGPYVCQGSYLVAAGSTTGFSLNVRVDQVIAGAQGSVSMNWSPDGSWRPPYDQDPADDTAAVTLN